MGNPIHNNMVSLFYENNILFCGLGCGGLCVCVCVFIYTVVDNEFIVSYLLLNLLWS